MVAFTPYVTAEYFCPDCRVAVNSKAWHFRDRSSTFALGNVMLKPEWLNRVATDIQKRDPWLNTLTSKEAKKVDEVYTFNGNYLTMGTAACCVGTAAYMALMAPRGTAADWVIDDAAPSRLYQDVTFKTVAGD
eukprot:scaffold8079_cov444-Prasinococcus_capsulatus_cf.AAC.5